MADHIIAGLFTTRDQANEALEALKELGCETDDLSLITRQEDGDIVDETESRAGEGAAIGAVTGGVGGLLLGLGVLAIPGIGPVLAAGPLVAALAGAGVGAAIGGLLGAMIDAGIPDDEAYLYVEGLRRGGTLLTAETETIEAADRVAAVMARHGAVDLDRQIEEWEADGWNREKSYREYQTALAEERPTTATATATTVAADVATAPASVANVDGKEVVEVVEESLKVGKRTVEDGRVRVYSRVVTEPVHEDVSLRAESVEVERRAVDRPVTAADAAFSEKEIRATSRHEEVVTEKEARVVEEIVVKKHIDTDVETVRDELRHTEVEVERDGGVVAHK